MFVCRRCDEEIPRDVDECPACGYDPTETARDAAAVLLVLSLPLLYAVPPAGVLTLFLTLCLYGYSLLASPATRVI